MSTKRGLGRDINKSIEIMEDLEGSLKSFAHMPLKKGLMSNKISDDDLIKKVNDASEQAFGLLNKVEDLKHRLSGVKPAKNSRFARNVVSRFLESGNNLLIH
jgi:hypothetical protein